MAKPHGQTRALKHFAPGGLLGPKRAAKKCTLPGCERTTPCQAECPSFFPASDGPHPWQRDASASWAMATEQPYQMTFGEQVVEALGEFVEAKIDYERSRQGPNAEYANPDNVNKTGERLQTLLDKVHHV